MTRQEIIDLITNSITSNGQNEITGAVLRPVLIAMVNQINDVTGVPQNNSLETDIQNVRASFQPSIQIFSGEQPPTITPPTNPNVGDIYQQIVGASPIALFFYDGANWVTYQKATI